MVRNIVHHDGDQAVSFVDCCSVGGAAWPVKNAQSVLALQGHLGKGAERVLRVTEGYADMLL